MPVVNVSEFEEYKSQDDWKKGSSLRASAGWEVYDKWTEKGTYVVHYKQLQRKE